MQLAKPRVDIGLATNDIEPMLRFWQGEAGVPFDHLLPIRKGQDQHRHDANGSVLKINHRADPIPDASPARVSRRRANWPIRRAIRSPLCRQAGAVSARSASGSACVT